MVSLKQSWLKSVKKQVNKTNQLSAWLTPPSEWAIIYLTSHLHQVAFYFWHLSLSCSFALVPKNIQFSCHWFHTCPDIQALLAWSQILRSSYGKKDTHWPSCVNSPSEFVQANLCNSDSLFILLLDLSPELFHIPFPKKLIHHTSQTLQ